LSFLALHPRRISGKLQLMSTRLLTPLCLLLLCAARLGAQPSAAALAAFNAYTRAVETRLAQQHRSPGLFLILNNPNDNARLLHGGLLITRVNEPLTAPLPADGSLLHHWRGTAFAPGATPEDFARLLRDFNSYPQHFAPQVLRARTLTASGDHLTAFMRVRQQHVITVVMDATYDVSFAQLDPAHGYSLSRSTHIAEIAQPNTPAEHALTPADEHGFLDRLNTYWSWEQRDGGLYIQIEAVSLTRAVPRGLGWAIGPYVDSIPRDSLEFTLRSACTALHS
jgi:hypothetical protein